MIKFVGRTPIPRKDNIDDDAHGIRVADGTHRRGEAPVLEGAAEVMTNEGYGLGEADEGAMDARVENWTRFELAWIDGRRTRI